MLGFKNSKWVGIVGLVTASYLSAPQLSHAASTTSVAPKPGSYLMTIDTFGGCRFGPFAASHLSSKNGNFLPGRYIVNVDRYGACSVTFESAQVTPSQNNLSLNNNSSLNAPAIAAQYGSPSQSLRGRPAPAPQFPEQQFPVQGGQRQVSQQGLVPEQKQPVQVQQPQGVQFPVQGAQLQVPQPKYNATQQGVMPNQVPQAPQFPEQQFPQQAQQQALVPEQLQPVQVQQPQGVRFPVQGAQLQVQVPQPAIIPNQGQSIPSPMPQYNAPQQDVMPNQAPQAPQFPEQQFPVQGGQRQMSQQGLVPDQVQQLPSLDSAQGQVVGGVPEAPAPELENYFIPSPATDVPAHSSSGAIEIKKAEPEMSIRTDASVPPSSEPAETTTDLKSPLFVEGREGSVEISAPTHADIDELGRQIASDASDKQLPDYVTDAAVSEAAPESENAESPAIGVEKLDYAMVRYAPNSYTDILRTDAEKFKSVVETAISTSGELWIRYPLPTTIEDHRLWYKRLHKLSSLAVGNGLKLHAISSRNVSGGSDLGPDDLEISTQRL